MPHFPNELFRDIMKIKNDTWIKLKTCVCGQPDFKECPIIECYGCDAVFCINQNGYHIWMWECKDCFEWFCGNHTFYITPTYYKICTSCCEGAYSVDTKYEIPTVPLAHLKILRSSIKGPDSTRVE